MNIDNKVRTYERSIYNNIDNNLIGINQPKNNEKTIKKENKKATNDINNRIKMKSKVINHEQRNIQDRISQIQLQEVKAETLENTLSQVKSVYTQQLDNAKQEASKKKIKIRQLSEKVKELQSEPNDENNPIEINCIDDKDKIISVINETLNKINKIKIELSKYKSKLISIESELRKSEGKVEKEKEYIKEEFIINPLEFIHIQGDLKQGVIIDIFI